MLSELF